MIKHILVPTDGSDNAALGVRYAAEVAARFQATLHGLYVVDVKLLEGPFLRDISASLGTAPYVNYQGSISLILEERGNAALKAFRDVCAEVGVPCETKQITGLVVRAIVEASELADLIVMGRGGEHGHLLDGIVGSTTEAVVRRVSTPVLVTATATVGRQRFMVAYDGSHHAKRALHVAADVCADWRVPLEVLVVGGEDAQGLLDEAKSFLDAYDLEVGYERKEGDPSETIIAHARACKADLLVMGAYGHTKVREWVVGSTTAYAIDHAPCPVLLAR